MALLVMCVYEHESGSSVMLKMHSVANSNCAHSFDFHCLINFAKNINLS